MTGCCFDCAHFVRRACDQTDCFCVYKARCKSRPGRGCRPCEFFKRKREEEVEGERAMLQVRQAEV